MDTNVEINGMIESAMFKMPAPPGMEPLMNMVGEWKVAVQTRQQPGSDWVESETTATIEKKLRGATLEETTSNSGGNTIVRNFSYDKFQEKYRLTSINDSTTHMDVEDGVFDEDGRLVVSNVDTGTTWSGFGMTFHSRMSVFGISENAFQVEYETSIDGGENWFVSGKATYSRATEQASN